MPQMTDEIFDQILERIAAGESVLSICKDADMPSQDTVYKHLNRNEVAAEKYARAKERAMDVYAEQIIEIADKTDRDFTYDPVDGLKVDGEHIQRAKLMVDSRKWLMSKLQPKKYGDKTTLSNDPDAPFGNSLADAILGGKK